MRALSVLSLAAVLAAGISATSGALGVYAIVERVVFEPDEAAPLRLQVWGSFAYVEITGQSSGLTTSPARRGYMYFRLPTGTRPAPVETVRTEWRDLKSVAGTGEAVGFGSWGYIGAFEALAPEVNSRQPPYILESTAGNPLTDLRVRPSTETPANPSPYQVNVGVVKLSAAGSHAAVVQKLREALKAGR
jgi:hypothetical protein